MFKDTKALWEAVKEFGRVGVLAALPIIIDALSAGEFDLKLTAIAVVVAVLRALDAYIHNSKNTPAKGLLPF